MNESRNVAMDLHEALKALKCIAEYWQCGASLSPHAQLHDDEISIQNHVQTILDKYPNLK